MTNEINGILSKIQTNLKAPKGQTNSFGRYKYRSCEDVLEALKPHLKDNGATLTLRDELVMIGDRYYIKATATFLYKLECIVVNGYAREEANKKGMDSSQITGACSSYARKYALNGLFLIDDNKDSDSTNKHGQGDQKEKLKPVMKASNKEASESIRQKTFLKLKSDLESCETVEDLKLCSSNKKFKEDSQKLDNVRAELLRGTYKGMKENLTTNKGK